MFPGIFDRLRLVEDDTAALQFRRVRGQCADAPNVMDRVDH